MVVICLLAAALTLVEQERAGSPFRCTVQAPHSAMPQPYLVPVMSRWSRSTHKRGVSGSASTCMRLPLTFRVIIEELLKGNPRRYFLLCRRLCVVGAGDAQGAQEAGMGSGKRALQRPRARRNRAREPETKLARAVSPCLVVRRRR